MKEYDGRKYRPKCAYCGVYLSYDADSYTSYGCADPEAPEPYDPEYLCKKHSEESYQSFLRGFKQGSRGGDWQKSEAERRAAKECGLAWVGSNGVGMLGTENWASAHRYITQQEYDRLSALPYWGYCKRCGAKNKNGFCSIKECENSFVSKNPIMA